MSLFAIENWLKSPADRDIIARWTVGAGAGMSHALALPAPADGEQFEFLAMGDTGASDAAGPDESPQEAVARALAADAALPESAGRAELVLHLGDVVYMTGERRLYERNFRRPYAPFLTPESTVGRFVFRLPFLPVPGNHDYYDLGSWAVRLTRVPLLGAGLRAVTHQLFAFSVPEGGSEMGRTYMEAFVDLQADTRARPLLYRPGERTRLPNRYYRFQVGSVDFLALDSNTLDAPPDATGLARAAARARIAALEFRARVLDRQLRRDQQALDRWRDAQRAQTAADPARLAAVAESVADVADALGRLAAALANDESPAGNAAAAATLAGGRHWAQAAADLAAVRAPGEVAAALRELEAASDAGCAAVGAVEARLAELPEGPTRAALLAVRESLEIALRRAMERVAPLPRPLCDRLQALSEESLDVQRELVSERRLARFRREDHDAAQLAWLEAALAESVRLRPEGWRVVYLHHPLYTSIANHCERRDVVDVRENLLPLLARHVHLVIAGHAHAFEWVRSSQLPHAGLFVTGGGGQVSLRPSLVAPRLRNRHRVRYQALRQAGVVECATGGSGPPAPDGADGPLYHYLRVAVSPERLRVIPVGVRRLAAGYRREAPMPVYHVDDLGEAGPGARTRQLEAVVIRRGEPPEPHWGDA